jgi:hypothetical protein
MMMCWRSWSARTTLGEEKGEQMERKEMAASKVAGFAPKRR